MLAFLKFFLQSVVNSVQTYGHCAMGIYSRLSAICILSIDLTLRKVAHYRLNLFILSIIYFETWTRHCIKSTLLRLDEIVRFMVHCILFSCHHAGLRTWHCYDPFGSASDLFHAFYHNQGRCCSANVTLFVTPFYCIKLLNCCGD